MIENLNKSKFIEGVFDRAAARYSCVGPEYFNYFGSKLIEGLKVMPGSTLLDIACGRGASLFPAAEKAGCAGNVIGIDFSENMVNETKKFIDQSGFTNVQITKMSAEKLVFDDSTFDAVSCGFAIQFFVEYQLALKEMLRVLKPGGKVGVTWWKKREKPSIPARIAPGYVDGHQNAVKEILRPDFGIPETLQEIFVEAGFLDINIIEENKRFYFQNEEQWWQDQWSHAGRVHLEAVEKLGPDIFERFKKDVLKELQKEKDDKGIYFDANVIFIFAKKSFI